MSTGGMTLTATSSVTGYCVVSDVQTIIMRVQFGVTTKVTTTDVETYINNRYDIINAKLQLAGYKVPVVSAATVSRRLLKELNAIGAAADAENAPVFAANPKGSEYGKYLDELFWKKLNMFADQPGLLYDAAVVQNRIMSSTEDESASKEAFPKAKVDEFVQDYRQAHDGDYSIDSGVKHSQGV